MTAKRKGAVLVSVLTAVSIGAAVISCVVVPMKAGMEMQKTEELERRMDDVENSIDRIPYIEAKVDTILTLIED